MEKAQIQDKPRRHRFRLRGKLLLVLIAAVVLLGAFVGGVLWSSRDTGPSITSDLIGQQLLDVQELSTVEYFYTNMGRYENQLDFYGWQVPFTTKRFIVSYDGVIKAGIDLSELKVSISGGTIVVALPPAKILSHEIPEESIEVFDETRNIFNQIAIEDYTGFVADQRADVEQKAVEKGLLTQADEKARSAVENLLALMPGMERYTLTVK